jgi:hypothetical protein
MLVHSRRMFGGRRKRTLVNRRGERKADARHAVVV